MLRQSKQQKILEILTKIENRVKNIEDQLEQDRKIVQPVLFLVVVFYTVLTSIVVANIYYMKDVLMRNQYPGHLEIGVSIVLIVLLLLFIIKAPAFLEMLIKIAKK